MADSNANNAVSSVAIIAIVVLTGLVVYLLFFRSGGGGAPEGAAGGEDGTRIELDVNEDGGSVEIEGEGSMAPAEPEFLTFAPMEGAGAA